VPDKYYIFNICMYLNKTWKYPKHLIGMDMQ